MTSCFHIMEDQINQIQWRRVYVQFARWRHWGEVCRLGLHPLTVLYCNMVTPMRCNEMHHEMARRHTAVVRQWRSIRSKLAGTPWVPPDCGRRSDVPEIRSDLRRRRQTSPSWQSSCRQARRRTVALWTVEKTLRNVTCTAKQLLICIATYQNTHVYVLFPLPMWWQRYCSDRQLSVVSLFVHKKYWNYSQK